MHMRTRDPGKLSQFDNEGKFLQVWLYTLETI